MDEDWWFVLGMASLAISVLLLAHAVKNLESDMELLRITAAVPASERGA